MAGPRSRHADVLTALARSDLRERYGRGPARMVKWLIDPFALVGVYLVLVTVVLDRTGRAPGLSLACAVVPFQLLIASVIAGLSCVALRRGIIRNMAFERALVPLASVVTETLAFAASLLLVAGLMLAYGVAPTLAVLWLPLLIALTVLLATAAAYPAALIGLWFPDLRSLAISIVRTLFFLAPGLVPLAEVPSSAQDLLKLNPLSGLFEGYRAVLVEGTSPDAWMLLVPLVASVALLAVCAPVFRSEMRHFAKIVDT